MLVLWSLTVKMLVVHWPFLQSHLILICKQNGWNLGIYFSIKWYSAWVKKKIESQNPLNKWWKYFENLSCENINLNGELYIMWILLEILKEFIYEFEFTWQLNNWPSSGNRRFKLQNKKLLKRHAYQLKSGTLHHDNL